MVPRLLPRHLTLCTLFTLGFPGLALGQSETLPTPNPNTQPAAPEAQAPLDAPPLVAPGPPAAPIAPQPAPPPPVGFSPFANPLVGHAIIRSDYRASWFPEEHVAGQPTDLGYVEQDLSLSFPLWQNETDEWSASAHVRNEDFQTHAVLPDTVQPFPEDLWNIHLGLTYRHLFDNAWIAGGTLTVGSASDKPFHSIDEMTFGINAFLRVPQGEHNAWLFSLAYSSNSQLPIPLPGVAFIYQPSDCFRMNIGLPFVVMYRPWEDWTFDFSYMLLTNVHARATYHVFGPLRLYAGYDWDNESYLLANRLNEEDRFFYYNQRLNGGLRLDLNPHCSLDLSAGYVFDRFYFEGRSLSDDHQNRLDVGDGPYGALQCQLRW